MKLFGRSGGYWLFWLSAVYLIVGIVNIFVYRFAEAEYIQMVFVLVLSLPLFIKPLANWLNMRTLWEK
jgi:hypothetical protein